MGRGGAVVVPPRDDLNDIQELREKNKELAALQALHNNCLSSNLKQTRKQLYGLSETVICALWSTEHGHKKCLTVAL